MILLSLAIVVAPLLAAIIWWKLQSKPLSTLEFMVVAGRPDGDMMQLEETAGD